MIDNHKLGVMQGRLVPKYNGRYQAHPVNYWQDEFFIAASHNLDCIEFILDYDLFETNPLMSSDGIESIKKHIDLTEVKVKSVCADYFMEKPFHHINNEIVKQSEVVSYFNIDERLKFIIPILANEKNIIIEPIK